MHARKALRWILRKAVLLLFCANLVLGLVAFLTSDADLDKGPARASLDAVIDGYELVGFGTMPIGVGVVAAVLLVLWLALRTRGK